MTDFNLTSLHPGSWTSGLFNRQGAAAPAGSVGFIDRLLTWQDRVAQRRQLAELNEMQLADIGIGRGDAMIEANKPFWRA